MNMIKLNVHMTMDKEIIEYCQEINAGIRRITESIIIFDEDSPMIPHITLVMGELDEGKHNLEGFAKIVEQLSSRVEPIEFVVPAPYIENIVNRYVFSDVDGGDAFLNLRHDWVKAIQGKYLCNVGGSYGEQSPHLTLGHVESRQDEVRTYLNSTKAHSSFLSTSIEISNVGTKGTCINSLYKFDLLRKKRADNQVS